MTDIFDELQWRGLIAVSTDPDALRAALAAGPVTFYVGFDPTAPSLHVGHLVQVLTARRLQQAGHRPLALVGGATGLIGDPKETGERTLNDPAVVAEWTSRLRRQIEPFLDFDGLAAATLVDNVVWTAPLSAIELLRDIGKHFSVNRMLDREAVSVRLAGPGISYTEFSYVLLQSNDFLELHRRYGCDLQLGGSDQWGNITAGVDLIRRVTSDRVHALSTPLLTKADGTKFGKTESGALWLDPSLTSPYAFYQHWVNADDRDVVRYLRVFSFRSREEIEELERAVAQSPAGREAQRTLARDLTALLHGESEAERAVAASRALFGQGEMRELDADVLEAALTEAPHTEATADSTYADLLVATGLVASKSAARRAIGEGGVHANNRRLGSDEADQVPAAAEYLHGRWLVLRRGKRAMAGVRNWVA
ncbi:MAG TPA: tyrosine--tRNA ligase [Actinomycetes bacterium]